MKRLNGENFVFEENNDSKKIWKQDLTLIICRLRLLAAIL